MHPAGHQALLAKRAAQVNEFMIIRGKNLAHAMIWSWRSSAEQA
jgi:hypothetical protein